MCVDSVICVVLRLVTVLYVSVGEWKLSVTVCVRIVPCLHFEVYNMSLSFGGLCSIINGLLGYLVFLNAFIII